MSRLHLLHVAPTYYPAARYGGPIYSVHALCRSLAAKGHHVEVFTTNVDGPGILDVRPNVPVDREGVKIWYFPTAAGRRVYRSPEMGHELKARMGHFDIVHVHSVFLWPTSAAAAAARAAGVPYVLAPRGMLIRELIMKKSPLAKSAWISLFEKRNLAHAAAVHTTSNVEAREFARLGLKAKRVIVIPNGIDLPPAVASCHFEASAEKTSSKVLFIGRINWKKGLDRLLPAMARVPGAELIVAGNDEEGYQAKLESIARAHDVADRVRFLGPVQGEDKWSLFALADLFVLPSYSENFGIAALEAMAAGCPVIVTPQVGLSETVRDVRAGLVSEGAPESLASAIRTLINDRELRARMGAAGRRAAAECFSWPSIAAQMEEVYRECIDCRMLKGAAA